jgi:hypothetical protein
MNTYALPALREKRARIAGEIDSLQRQIARHVEELVSLDQTIVLFDPSYRVGSIRPITTRTRAKLFKMGELGRIILSALRKAKRPMRTPALITAVSLAVGLDKSANNKFRGTVASSLNYLARRGRIVKVGGGQAARWELAKELV